MRSENKLSIIMDEEREHAIIMEEQRKQAITSIYNRYGREQAIL